MQKLENLCNLFYFFQQFVFDCSQKMEEKAEAH